MGKLSEITLGRRELPARCLILGGVYVPSRAEVIAKQFDTWSEPRGEWVKHAYAKKGGKEYLICFNVYGAATTLELLHLLSDGRARSAFFVGSMGSGRLEIGTLVLPDRVVDRAGIVQLDDPSRPYVEPDPKSISKIERVLKAHDVPFVRGTTCSVPAVLHNLKPVKRFLASHRGILGVELELSTFHYFGPKLGLKTMGLLYVWDNPKHGIVSGPQTVWKVRLDTLGLATEIALAVL